MTSEQQQRQPSLAPLRTKYRSTGSASPLVDAGVALRVRTRPGDSAPTLSGAATKVKGTQAPKVAEAQSPDQRPQVQQLRRGVSNQVTPFYTADPAAPRAGQAPQPASSKSSTPQAKAASSPTSGAGEVAGKPVWREQGTFEESERARRSAHGHTPKEKAFFSHCWRDPETQVKKRRIIDHFSAPKEVGGGDMISWADYLDLKAEGPIPWRKEIEEGIASCSKFVVFVDKAWLTSYNCLQELALAINHGKPIVVLVLERQAWELLTVPGGSSQAKAEADAHHVASLSTYMQSKAHPSQSRRQALKASDIEAAAYRDGEFGHPLCTYAGEEIVPGRPMSLHVMQELFGCLAAINLCDCGTHDGTLESETDWRAMLGMALSYVEKDLAYHKQHAELKTKADSWQAAVAARSPLPLLQEAEAAFWRQWLRGAETHNLNPQPTDRMKAYLAASERHSRQRRGVLNALWTLLLLVLAAGVAGSTVLALQSRAARDGALAAEELAEQRALEAETARDEADKRALEAQESRTVAERLAFEAAVTANDSAKATAAVLCQTKFASMPYAGDMEFKVLREMLARLPGEVAAFSNATILDAGRALLKKPWHYIAQVLQGRHGAVLAVAWAPNSRSLASKLYDGTVRVMRVGEDGAVEDGAQQMLHGRIDFMNSLAWAPSGRSLASASNDGTVRVWKVGEDGGVDDGAPQVLNAGSEGLTSVAWAPDSRTLASGSSDHAIYVWRVGSDDAVKDSAPQVLRGHSGMVMSVAWAHDGRSLASGSLDRSVRVWRTDARGAAEDGAPQVLRALEASRVLSVAWAPGSRSLASGDEDGIVRVWRVGEDGLVEGDAPQVLLGHEDQVFSVAWAPDGRSLASGSEDAAVHVWYVGEDGTIGDGALQELRDHVNTVFSVAWAPDGSSLASGSADATLRVRPVSEGGAVDVATSQVVQSNSDRAWSLASAPDGRSLATGREDGAVHVHRVGKDGLLEVGGALQVLRGHTERVVSLAWAPNSRALASGSYDGTVQVWRVGGDNTVEGAAPQVLHHHAVPVTSVAWAPDSRSLASGLDNGTVHVWSVSKDGAVEEGTAQVLSGYSGVVLSVAWAPNGRFLAYSFSDGIVRVWPTSGGGPQVLRDHTDRVHSVVWAPDGRSLASKSHDGVLVVRRVGEDGVVEGGAPQVLRGHDARSIGPVVWAPDGRCLAFGFLDGTLLVYRVGKDGVVQDGAQQVLRIDSISVISVAWASDSRSLASSWYDSAVRIWRVGDDNAVADGALLRGHTHAVYSVAWAPDGRSLAAGSYDTVRIWQPDKGGASDGGDPHALRDCTDWVHEVAWAPDGRSLAAGCSDGTVRVRWVGSDGAAEDVAPQMLSGHTERVWTVAWAPDGRSLASGSFDATVRVWRVGSDGTVEDIAPQVLRGTTTPVLSVAWAPDGRSLASGSTDSTLQVWSVRKDGVVENDTPQVLLGHTEAVRTVAWAHGGHSLASGSFDGTVRVWRLSEDGDVTGGAPPQVLHGHTDPVSSVAWAPDGRSLASGSMDGTVRVWELGEDGAAKGGAPQVLHVDNGSVDSVAWAPDSRSLASGHADGTVRVWGLLRVEHMAQALEHQLGLHTWNVSAQQAIAQGYPASLFALEPVYAATTTPLPSPAGSLSPPPAPLPPPPRPPAPTAPAPPRAPPQARPPPSFPPPSPPPTPPCPSNCPRAWLGDGECDLVCNSEACDFDGNDCAPTQAGAEASFLCDGSATTTSNGSAKKPHCTADLAAHNITWDLPRCADALCVAAGCGGGTLVESGEHAPAACAAQAGKQAGAALLSCPMELQVSARCWAPPFERLQGGFDMQNTAIEMGGGGGPPWCILPEVRPLASEAAPPERPAPLTLGDDDALLIPLASFDFTIAGQRYTEVCLSSNGFLGFGSSCTYQVNGHMAVIAAFNTDLDPSRGGSITYWEVPAERLVVRFLEVPLYGALDKVASFQVDLLAEGRVRIAYGDAPAEVDVSVGVLIRDGSPLRVDMSTGATC
eukprot:jgi/Tetstr1/437389/TSEL_026073.t1